MFVRREVAVAVHRPAVQRVSVEGGRMWQRLFVMWLHAMMTRLRLIGRRLDDTVSPPPALKSSSPCGLTFYHPVHLRVDPCVDLSVGLVLMGGACCVSQVPIPQTFQCQRLVEAPGGLLQLGFLGGGQLWWSGGQ